MDMLKAYMQSNVKPGCKVAFNTLPDAAWFIVQERDGFTITIRDATLPNGRVQYSDISLVEQVKP